jgi:hypothetical protein
VCILHSTVVSVASEMNVPSSTLQALHTCNFCYDFLLLMDVNEWVSYECSDEGTYAKNIYNSSTRSHPPEGENRTRNRSKNCKCKPALANTTGFLVSFSSNTEAIRDDTYCTSRKNSLELRV